MKIEWRRPNGTESFTDAQMDRFYQLHSYFVMASMFVNVDELEIDELVLSEMRKTGDV